ncbi:HEAT repeat domain-containing protein [Kitasatospora sp. NPDC092286]|uniref:HEAT repeat domain-containing protein n=1 Tax=Kitasatospora sp. NPDC092286 TaxID=3364087 RepID=UPI0037F8430C
MIREDRSAAGGYLDRPAEYWMSFVRSDDPTERRLGVYALGEIGSVEVVPALEAALHDSFSFVRVWAAAALARAACDKQKDAVLALSAESADSAGFVRSLVAWSLGRLSYQQGGEAAAVQTLRVLLEDPDASVRAEADLALHQILRRARRMGLDD